jgi:hypothetical protein
MDRSRREKLYSRLYLSKTQSLIDMMQSCLIYVYVCARMCIYICVYIYIYIYPDFGTNDSRGIRISRACVLGVHQAQSTDDDTDLSTRARTRAHTHIHARSRGLKLIPARDPAAYSAHPRASCIFLSTVSFPSFLFFFLFFLDQEHLILVSIDGASKKNGSSRVNGFIIEIRFVCT